MNSKEIFKNKQEYLRISKRNRWGTLKQVRTKAAFTCTLQKKEELRGGFFLV